MGTIVPAAGVFVHSIATGAGEYGDVWSSFYGNVNKQVENVCEELADKDELSGGFHMVGFSQGGQFLRVCVAQCAMLRSTVQQCGNVMMMIIIMIIISSNLNRRQRCALQQHAAAAAW